VKQNPINLHNLLQQGSYDHAVICTYTFDPFFFEEYCLERFNSLRSNNNITVIVDDETYFSAISDQIVNKPRQANVRYLLHPISVPGKFHSKLFLLVSNNKGRLIIGSANFTKPGITSNAELVNYYDYENEKHEEFKFLFQSAFIFLNELGTKWPSNALSSNLSSIQRDASWLVAEEKTEINQEVGFFHNLEKPLWEQILSYIHPPVDTIHVLSRYFDANPNLLDRIVNDLSPRTIKIYTQNGITTLTNEWIQHSLFRDHTLEVYLCSYKDEEHIRNLHAKAIAIETGSTYSLMYGSANFTTSALMKSSNNGNIEVLLLLKDLPTKELQPVQLFDPLGSSLRLHDEKELQSTPHLITGIALTGKLIHLNNAELVGNRIIAKLIISPEISYDRLHGRIVFQNGAYSRVVFHNHDNEEYLSDSVESIVNRLGESSILVIEADSEEKRVAESNPILITNLLDIWTGHYVRRERYIREAQQGSLEFFRVLDSLIKEGDEDPLITFFNFCDIPIIDVSSSGKMRVVRPIWDGGKGMRSLGDRNLTIFRNLHDAAMNFYTRHFKKLQRHVKGGSINGVANYLHIFLAMGGILRSQIERLIQGFEACNAPILADDWYYYRTNIDTYFMKYKDLMLCLHDQYMPMLLKHYRRASIRERFAPDLQPIKDLSADMLEFYYRMDALSKSKIEIVTQDRRTIHPPPYFRGNVFDKDNWREYEEEQKAVMRNVLITLS
jgi:hypothetical protein